MPETLPPGVLLDVGGLPGALHDEVVGEVLVVDAPKNPAARQRGPGTDLASWDFEKQEIMWCLRASSCEPELIAEGNSRIFVKAANISVTIGQPFKKKWRNSSRVDCGSCACGSAYGMGAPLAPERLHVSGYNQAPTVIGQTKNRVAWGRLDSLGSPGSP